MKHAEKTTLYCSFCGKNQHEVLGFVRSHDASTNICGECVTSCVEILSAETKASSVIIDQ